MISPKKAPKTDVSSEQWDLSHFLVTDINPTWQNGQLYAPFAIDNDDDWRLVESIRANGIQEPLVLSADGHLLSGHRRLAAARYLNLETVPVRTTTVVFERLSHEARLQLLQQYNQQRDKTFDERVRERLLHIDPKAAYRETRNKLIARFKGPPIEPNITIGERKRRAEITTIEFRDKVIKIVRDNKPYWPLTDRRIHYLLLNDPPLRHDRKPDRYSNTSACYKALTNLLTRLRVNRQIPMEAIEDPTRPVLGLQGFDSAEQFVEQQFEDLLEGYSRNLMQGQSAHLEIVLEKAALRTIVEEVAREFCIPVTTSRGYCSLKPRYDIATRFRRSGKSYLVLLFLTDFDPDGEQIAASFASSMRDDFGISSMRYTKVLLTSEDVKKYDLPSDMDAKPSSPQYSKFVRKHGYQAVELDAAPVDLIQDRLREAIQSVIDLELYNAQVRQEEEDCAIIQAKREAVIDLIQGQS